MKEITFLNLLSIILENEGGYCFITGDKGGETYCGITRNFEGDWVGWPIIDQVKAKRKNGKIKYNEKLKEIKIEMLQDFYLKKYFNQVKGNELLIINPLLCCHVFDMSVNAGVTKSSKLLQQCVNAKADGIIGNLTLDSLRKMDASKVCQKFIAARINFYKAIAKGSNEQFLEGWLNRVKNATQKVLQLQES